MSGLPASTVLRALAKLPIDQQIRQLQVRLRPAKLPAAERAELTRYFVWLRVGQIRDELKGAK